MLLNKKKYQQIDEEISIIPLFQGNVLGRAQNITGKKCISVKTQKCFDTVYIFVYTDNRQSPGD